MTGSEAPPGTVVAPPVRVTPPAQRTPTTEDTFSAPAPRTTLLVVDSGVLAVALADDGSDGDHARRHLTGHRLLSVPSATTEILGIWQQAVRTGALSTDRVRAALHDLAELPLVLVGPGSMLDRCWELQERMHAHDASVLALAEAIDAPLLTTNPRLADVTGTKAQVVLLR
jgi:predicted nucleic acid-binding protein